MFWPREEPWCDLVGHGPCALLWGLWRVISPPWFGVLHCDHCTEAFMMALENAWCHHLTRMAGAVWGVGSCILLCVLFPGCEHRSHLLPYGHSGFRSDPCADPGGPVGQRL